MATTYLRISGLPSLAFVAIVISLFSAPSFQAYAHVGEGDGEPEEQLVLSRYVKGNLNLSVNPEAEQWERSTENIVESAWQHDVQVMSLNNGTHIFFLLSWDDTTRAAEGAGGVADGAAILFETTQLPEGNGAEREMLAEAPDQQLGEHDEGPTVQEEGEEKQELWYWSTESQESENSDTDSVFAKSEWEHDHWNVLMGRRIIADDGSTITFRQGVREEGFVKFVVWDGDKGESFEQIDDEELTHFDFVMLPEIDVYPKDVYVWSGILVAGTAIFLFVELGLYKRQKREGAATTSGGRSIVK